MPDDPVALAAPANSRGDALGGDQRLLTAAPDILVRTIDGCIISWSPGMERRYGFCGDDALGQKSHQLLRTVFPRALPEIEALLMSRQSWSGGLMHRHADGGPVMAVNHWFLSRDCENQEWRVTEVHCDVAPESEDTGDQLADLLEVVAHELSEPLTAIRNYVDAADRILRPGWPDLEHLRTAMTHVKTQVARGSAGVRLLRALAVAMRDEA